MPNTLLFRSLILLAICSLLVACRPASTTLPSDPPSQTERQATLPKPTPTTKPITAIVASFHERITKNSALTFRSWNGQWQGTDCDTDIQFLPDHAARMIEYGFSVQQYMGAYDIAANGIITCTFKEYSNPWPPMQLSEDSQSLLVNPIAEPHFMTGNRGGATISVNAGSHWPFRPLSESEEAQLRKFYP